MITARAVFVLSSSSVAVLSLLPSSLPWATVITTAVSERVVKSYVFRPPFVQPVRRDECTASCRDHFTKLECDGVDCEEGGTHHQHVHVQERGEPKSGTGFMYEWTMGALSHACTYLVRAYGDGSCWIEWEFKNRTLIFDPAQAERGTGTCECDGVSRVVITAINRGKHTLPVSDTCGYCRRGGMAQVKDTACVPPDGHYDDPPPTNRKELWDCAQKADCAVAAGEEGVHQMAVMRDPRPMAVSAYFHQLINAPRYVEGYTVDGFALAILPILSQWLSVRTFVFRHVATNSTWFWYDDALADPESWHRELFAMIGLDMPGAVVAKAASDSVDGNRMFNFPSKGMDVHAGGRGRQLNSAAAGVVPARSYRDEVNATTLSQMDDVLRNWLPPAVLEKLQVFPVV